jgi:hypothetical protein
MEGAMLDAALTVTVLVGDAETLPELSRASATTSAGPGGTPAKDAAKRQLFPWGSRSACPMLFRLRKNSTPTTEPSESVAVAVKFTREAVVVVAGTVSVKVAARPERFETTTRRDTALVPEVLAPTVAWLARVNVSAVVGVQIAR